MARQVVVHGLGDLTRAFKVMPVEVKEDLVWELEEAANPVKLAAQAKAPGSMRNMVFTKEWAAMRVKVVAKNPAGVAVIPQLSGRTGRKRTQKQKDNYAKQMQSRALDPALKENQEKVFRRVEDFLGKVGKHNGF